MDIEEVRSAYDSVASQYHTRLREELRHKPFDCEWLDWFAAQLDSDDRAVEVGCGDGHVAAYLAGRGVRVEGLDVSSDMIAVARNAYPGLRFSVGDMRELPFVGAGVSAIVSFYSIVNLEERDCAAAFDEFHRVIRRGGLATVAFHCGDERLRVENWWGTSACLNFVLHPVDRICEQLSNVGFEIIRRELRAPYGIDVEAQTNRAYIAARPMAHHRTHLC